MIRGLPSIENSRTGNTRPSSQALNLVITKISSKSSPTFPGQVTQKPSSQALNLVITKISSKSSPTLPQQAATLREIKNIKTLLQASNLVITKSPKLRRLGGDLADLSEDYEVRCLREGWNPNQVIRFYRARRLWMSWTCSGMEPGALLSSIRYLDIQYSRARCKILGQGIKAYNVNAKMYTIVKLQRAGVGNLPYNVESAPTLTFPTDTQGLNQVLQSLHHSSSLPLASLVDKHDGTCVCTRR